MAVLNHQLLCLVLRGATKGSVMLSSLSILNFFFSSPLTADHAVLLIPILVLFLVLILLSFFFHVASLIAPVPHYLFFFLLITAALLSVCMYASEKWKVLVCQPRNNELKYEGGEKKHQIFF